MIGPGPEGADLESRVAGRADQQMPEESGGGCSGI